MSKIESKLDKLEKISERNVDGVDWKSGTLAVFPISNEHFEICYGPERSQLCSLEELEDIKQKFNGQIVVWDMPWCRG